MKDIEIAKYLAEEGLSFSKELHKENRVYFEESGHSYFAIASAIALCWTGHAHYEDEFVQYAASFVDGKIPKDSSISINYCKRFGAEGLDMALTGYRAFYKRIRNLMPDFNTCSIQDINRLQQRLLYSLNEFRNTSEVLGIGPWLFLGPFKIILGDQKRLWDVEGLSAIVLPTGIEVDRGINRLKGEGFSFMKDFDLNWLEGSTGSLLDNYATCSMVHAHLIKIADLAQTSALHINSALYQYGRNDI